MKTEFGFNVEHSDFWFEDLSGPSPNIRDVIYSYINFTLKHPSFKNLKTLINYFGA